LICLSACQQNCHKKSRINFRKFFTKKYALGQKQQLSDCYFQPELRTQLTSGGICPASKEISCLVKKKKGQSKIQSLRVTTDGLAMQEVDGDEPCDDSREKRRAWRWRRADIHQLTQWQPGEVCSQTEQSTTTSTTPRTWTRCHRHAVVKAPPPVSRHAPSPTENDLVTQTFVRLHDDSKTCQSSSLATKSSSSSPSSSLVASASLANASELDEDSCKLSIVWETSGRVYQRLITYDNTLVNYGTFLV